MFCMWCLPSYVFTSGDVLKFCLFYIPGLQMDQTVCFSNVQDSTIVIFFQIYNWFTLLSVVHFASVAFLLFWVCLFLWAVAYKECKYISTFDSCRNYSCVRINVNCTEKTAWGEVVFQILLMNNILHWRNNAASLFKCKWEKNRKCIQLIRPFFFFLIAFWTDLSEAKSPNRNGIISVWSRAALLSSTQWFCYLFWCYFRKNKRQRRSSKKREKEKKVLVPWLFWLKLTTSLHWNWATVE